MANVVNGKTTLFIGGLPTEIVNESILESLCIPFGDLVKIQLPLDMETGKPKGTIPLFTLLRLYTENQQSVANILYISRRIINN